MGVIKKIITTTTTIINDVGALTELIGILVLKQELLKHKDLHVLLNDSPGFDSIRYTECYNKKANIYMLSSTDPFKTNEINVDECKYLNLHGVLVMGVEAKIIHPITTIASS